MSGTDLAYAVWLRVWYAMSGTDLVYAVWLRLWYAMSGTDLAYAVWLRACYAMSGTDLAYGATRGVDMFDCVLPTRSAALSPDARATRCPVLT
eukprot:700335-Rhodomonas_salina.6